MAKIHGTGDENRIAWPELELAIGAFDGTSTSCE
jgi:hypothetical protein